MEFSAIPIAAIKAFHAIERALFSRLVLDLGLNAIISMELIAFWLWLAENGHTDLIRQINGFDDSELHSAAVAAQSFLNALRREPLPSPDVISIDPPPALKFRKSAIQGITYYLQSVCYKAFDDIIEKAEEKKAKIRRMELLVQQMSRAYLVPTRFEKPFRPYVPHGEGTSRGGALGYTMDLMNMGGQGIPQMLVDPRVFAGKGSMMPYCFEGGKELADRFVPRDERTLFVTFSNGYPLSEDELFHFFMRRYGGVEMVNIQHVNGETHPLFAHVAFFNLVTVLRILNGNVKVKFMTNGKHLWARRFIPKRDL